MPKIFLSYRRNDSQDVTGRIYDRLAAHFGSDAVFMDVDSIPYGVDFRSYLGEWVGRCDLLLAVMGKNWLTTPGNEGSKLGDPSDFVTIELAAALQRQIPVVPVLVGQAQMPHATDLPPVISDLAYRHAAEVRSGRDFHVHMDQLIRGIERLFESTPRSAQLARDQAPTTERQKPLVIKPPLVSRPTNLGFEEVDLAGRPVGWFDSLGYVSGVSVDYQIQVMSRADVPAGKCLEMSHTEAGEREFGSWMQRCPATDSVGKPLLLQAQMETVDLDRFAGIWLRIDDERYHVFFDNMSDRPIRGTTPWTTYLIETRVPKTSLWLNYGVLLAGSGKLRVDNFQLAVPGPDGAWQPWES